MKKTSDINGTSLQGYISITFLELVDQLGKPHSTNMDKVTAEWAFKDGDAVFTIYDYKEDATPIREYEWHIGGLDSSVLLSVKKLFPNNNVRSYR